jgi:hypothetical protein
MAIGIKELAVIAGIILAIWIVKRIGRERELARRQKRSKRRGVSSSGAGD